MSLDFELDDVGSHRLSGKFRAKVPEGVEIFPPTDFDQAYENIQEACRELKGIITDIGIDVIGELQTLREAVNSGELTEEEALPRLEGLQSGLEVMREGRSTLQRFSTDLEELGVDPGECSIEAPAPLPPQ